ncbi:MAG: hypothetical protein H7Y32_10255 [Chloroflexales bacterium]|nr:hypothetical protein [Chloroflexales bacterium]
MRTHGLVIFAYALLAVLFTYPLAWHLNSYVVGLEVDAEEYLWSFWWMRKAVLELGANPYFTNWLYYPRGVSLYFFASNPLHAFLSIPLQLMFGLIAAYNLMALLAFAFSGYTMYLLARDVTGSRAAAFVAGVLFAFAPTQVFHLEVGQPNLNAVEFLPLYVLCVWRWARGGGLRWLLGAVIALALCSFADWQFAVYCQLFLALLLLAELLARRAEWRRALLDLGRRALALQALYALTVLPMVIPMYRELGGDDPYMLRKRADTIYHAADLLAFLVPNPLHPLWRAWAEPLRQTLQVQGILVTVVSLSYVGLLLALVAIWRAWPLARFWLLSGAFFLVLALGPELLVLGQSTGILLPYELLWQLPIIKVSRTPARYVTMALVCLAVASAIGARELMRLAERKAKSEKRRAKSEERSGTLNEQQLADGRRLPPAVVLTWLAILAALCFELLPAPLGAHAPPTPPSFYVDGTLQTAGAVLEVPSSGNRGMGYAVLHDRPIVYGELSRDNPGGPLLNYVRDGIWGDDIIEDRSSWGCIYGMYNITHAVLYPWLDDDPDWRTRMRIIRKRLGPAALMADTPQGQLYQLPAVSDGATCVLVGEGFKGIRPFENGTIYRWGEQATTMGLVRRAPGKARLHFTAHSFALLRQLEVRHGGQLVTQLEVNGTPQEYTVDLDLPAGLTWLELRSAQPAVSPKDYGYTETEPIAVGYSQVWVEER